MPKRTWKRVSLALIAVAIAFAGFFAHHFAQDRSPVPQVAIEAVPEAGTASGSEMRHEQEAGEIVASRPTMLDSYAQLVDAAMRSRPSSSTRMLSAAATSSRGGR